MKRKVYIDVNNLVYSEALTGIGRYVRNLAGQLHQLEEPELEMVHHYFGLFPVDLNRYGFNSKSIESLRVPYDWQFSRGFNRLFNAWCRIKSFKEKCLYHGTSFILPRFEANVRKVVTVHDLAFLKFKGTESAGMTRLLTEKLKFSVSAASRIICVSGTTESDLLKYFPMAEGKTRVIYSGAEQAQQIDQERIEEVKSINGIRLPDNFLLFLGTMNKRKNLILLLKALEPLKGIKLVAAGKPGNQTLEIKSFLRAAGLSRRVIIAGYVDDIQKKILYRKCRALVVPSLDEGFGFPVLEAMSFDVPCLTSDAGALKELFSATALTFHSQDEGDLREKLVQVWNNPGLRQRLVKAGRNRLSDFSWAKTARQTMDVYKELLL